MNNKYDVGVWKLSYYKIDTETGDALCDDKGDVIEFYVPNEERPRKSCWVPKINSGSSNTFIKGGMLVTDT